MTIKTWRERCEEHPDHEGIVTEQMIRNRMQEEIDELRQAIEDAVAAEREACAKVCEDEASRAKWNWGNDLPQNQPFWNGGEQLASSCAAAIRARGEE